MSAMSGISRVLLILITACVWTAHAHAAQVLLVPASAIYGLSNGSLVTFDIYIDFRAEGGTLGGGFDVTYNDADLGVVSFSLNVVGDGDWLRAPNDLNGVLQSWSVGDFDGISTSDVVLLGQIVFQVLPAMGDTSTLMIGGTTSVGGPWISGTDFVTAVNPFYNQVQIGRGANPAIFDSGFESFGVRDPGPQ